MPAEADARATEEQSRPTHWEPAEDRASSAPYARAANEDDDGYDPWSDRQEEAPLFEPDPWE